MRVVRNIVEGVKFIIATMVCTVLVVVWHCGCHQLIKETRRGRGNYNLRDKKNKI